MSNPLKSSKSAIACWDISSLTNWYGPNNDYFCKSFRSWVKPAVVDGVSNSDVAVQRDGTEVHDGGSGEKHIQVDPNGTELRR